MEERELRITELRIGNLFLLPNGNVGTITYHEIRLLVIAAEKPNYNPIPLTEEWLVKFGFKIVLNLYWGRGLNGILVNKNFTPIFCDGRHIEDEIGIKLEHVHQLQNLYFALTGEELTP